MAKRFKLRFSRVIPSFQFCRFKHPSTFPESPIPAIYRLSPVNPKAFDITYPNFPDPPPSTPTHLPIKRHVSSKIVSVGCGCRSKSCAHYLSSDCSGESPGYTWKREDKWHVVKRVDDDKARRKIYGVSDTGDFSGDVSPCPPPKTKKQLKNQKSKNKKEKPKAKAKAKSKSSVRTSTSSGDSGWFSSEVNDETETLISSRSFSNDSSYDFDLLLDSKTEKSSNCKKKSNVKKIRRLKRYVSRNWRGSVIGKTKSTTTKTTKTPSPEAVSPARPASVFKRMMPCTVDGKVMESFAVVKKSEDPYEDFKKSMLEMILEKQMFEAKDLEELLHCFLSLNSRHHHGVIVEAFSEIWEVLFCKSPVNHRASMGL
ncbi:hypothetical protein L1049_026837 [Liquidambar formosana]|uniref:Transcription repressor n=1 Tax=Liquidambar formosana TaxID=63359 RepID=A0AAP0NDD8_LIQFO